MTAEQRVPRAAYVTWLIGLAAYVMAVFNRTSFGVAVIPAAHRFHASASDLASFTVVQLIVYAGLQIPVGVLLDRVGARRLIIAGGVLMTLGQLGLAFSTSVSTALLMRILIGAGDAVTFISVLRVVTDTFPGRTVPVITQLTGIFGQLGGVLSAIPLAAMLGSSGWTRSFELVASLGALVTVLVIVALRVEDVEHRTAPGLAQAWEQIKGAWRHPGTQLGLWTHFTTQFSPTVFTLLWGFPFLISGEGQSRGTASMLLTVNVAAGAVVSPLLGRLVARHPLRRSWMVLSITLSCVAGWTLVLAWPGQAPLWVLVVLVVSIAAGGPGSMIGFDFARTFNPSERIGTASGIVNVGGFVASLSLMYAMGVTLDLLTPGHGSDYSLSAFKWAFGLQYLIWAGGTVAILVSRRRVIRREEIVIPKIREAVLREYRARRDRREQED
ncbi:MFS transporter [Nocardioides terrisoli]|uniref:MFS transporter n=1 Tax=Nocardioides terrisoli TaxID=3388267 RepID=UPI00287B9177|nr:MFS transporter [Nocardioides marmorisolisilvae]